MGLNPRLSRIPALSYMAIKQILIIRVCAIGDFILNLPALTALQQLYPNARFTLVGNVASLELAREFVSVENTYSIESPPWSRLFYEALTDLEFDSAIVWMKDSAVAANLQLTGIPSVYRADPFPTYGHAADHLLRTLKLERPILPDLWSLRSDDIIIHPGSGSPKKMWPHFESLLERLPNAVVLRDRERIRCARVLENLSLVELSQHLRRCRAYIGNDSGITHLAAYLGCPTIALFGPTDPRVWGPIGRRSRIIWKTKLEDITVDDVLLALHATSSRTRIDG
jgi:heptosyltransferase-3